MKKFSFINDSLHVSIIVCGDRGHFEEVKEMISEMKRDSSKKREGAIFDWTNFDRVRGLTMTGPIGFGNGSISSL